MEGTSGMEWRGSKTVFAGICVVAIIGILIQPAVAQLTANSLADLRTYGTTVNNSTITLSPTGGDPHPVTGIVTPGEYWIDGDHIANPTSTHPRFMVLGGTGNTYNLTGTTINLDTRELDGFGRALGHDSGVDVVRIEGSNNTVNDLTLIGQDIALDTDPSAQRFADWATQYVELSGDNNTVDGAHVVSRGSRTDSYGLSDAFGKGASQGISPFISHRKASNFRVGEATNAVVNDVHLETYSFGHGFFVQGSTDTTLTNSTVTGELFSSQLVVDHTLYQQYGHTWWGEPIPNDIMLSGAEGGVRMYTGASGLTVDNVVVDGMRTGFATVHAGGDVNISNSYAYNTTSGFDVGDNTTITSSGGNIVNGPLLVFYNSGGNNEIELELEGGTPIGTNWSAVYGNGGDTDITITSSLPAGALPDESYIRLGQSYFENWRNFDYTTATPESGSPIAYTDSHFVNNTNQMLVFGESATGITGSSQAPVISNGKENYYDGITLVPAGTRTVLIHSAGLGNNGTAADGSLETNASIVESGGTLELQPGIQISDEKLTITGEGVDGKGALYSDGQTGSGTRFGSSDSQNESTIFLAGDASIGVGVAGNQMLVGSIQGTGNLTKRGPGKLAIEQASTYVGNMFIAEGEVSARSGVVKDDLFLFPGTTFTSIGDNALDAADSFAQVNGTLDLNGRTDNSHLSATAGLLYGAGQILSSNPTSGAGATLNVAGDAGQGTFVGTIEDEISLIKSGASTQLLAGNNTYTGTTTISEGTLQVNGTHTGGGDYTVAGGTLAGTGSIDASVTVQAGGTLAPGASPGQLTVGDVVFETSSVLEIELGGLTAGSEYDQLLADSIILAGDLSVSLLDLGSGLFQPAPTDIFTVIDGISLSGVFDNVAIGQRIDTTGGEGSFMVSYVAPIGAVLLTDYQVSTMPGDFNGDGWVDALDFLHWQRDPAAGDLADWQDNYGATNIHNANAVPEPTALALFAVALFACSMRRRFT